MEFIWGNKRRFNSYSSWCKQTFGTRVQKVSVNAGFTCPNRDGTLGKGGCTFCNNLAFNPASSYSTSSESLFSQIDKGLSFLKKRYKRSGKYVAYFQAYSNTYADIDVLKKVYQEALSHPEISGLVIGTRPDCINEEKLEYLKSLSEKYFISVEYGVESCNDNTLLRVNRGHDFYTSQKAIKLTSEFGIHVGAHFIFGLPGESKEDLLKQLDIISQLPLNSIKFHQLQIVKDTKIANEYITNPEDFVFFELPEYVDFITSFIERLNPYFSIERISGEVPPRFNLGKRWGMIRADQVITMVEKKLLERDSWQGKYYNL